MKRILLIALCCGAVAALTFRPAAAKPTLGIGSKAPALSIEHYFDEDDKPVTKFEAGNVYVVEFWATWCGPCIASMPHLAELQTKYRENGVRIISVSDESVEEIEAVLNKPFPDPKVEASYAEVTMPYTLTTDPDRSVYSEYMDASEQSGIPTAFIVGKSGLVEWIGHPMEMDQPLAAVVDGTWDRAAYKKMIEAREAFQREMQVFAELAGTEKFDEAQKMLDTKVSESEGEIKERWTSIRHQFHLMAGRATEADFEFVRAGLAQAKGYPMAVIQQAGSLYGMAMSGADVGPLGTDAIKALKGEADAAEDRLKPQIYELTARWYALDEKLDEAIAVQEKAVESAADVSRSQKRRAEQFLEELKAAKEKLEEKKSADDK